MQATIKDIPDEIIRVVISYLEMKSVGRLQVVSKKYQKLVSTIANWQQTVTLVNEYMKLRYKIREISVMCQNEKKLYDSIQESLHTYSGKHSTSVFKEIYFHLRKSQYENLSQEKERSIAELDKEMKDAVSLADSFLTALMDLATVLRQKGLLGDTSAITQLEERHKLEFHTSDSK